ncbi:MAG: bifunctional folylpolyglutamate synthase/dihydrofolate synthase [Oscillospiraceae bacterium]|jgi:dihydrofolate synthase/folylpolyglutamate synthase|nr:bifunctional folylpolyglutamate synthase/dihydrofolate synthase [Oscillospiraceae bacterium]
MTYPEALEYIHALERFGIKPGLERIRALCAALGEPQQRLPCIHVAGTNGKGSTCAMLAGICRAAGLRTGLYTSPYVLDFRERMQVEGEMIPAQDLARWVERLRPLAEALPAPPTEFEFITALAFAWFAEQRCDVVILETGLGGRWDATNVIAQPLCSVITKISLDHTQILGDTIEKIAAEKCGILKPGCLAVSCCEQPPAAYNVIQATAARLGCPLEIPNAGECEALSLGLGGGEARLAGLPVRVPFAGEHMCRNALTAVVAARLLRRTGRLALPEAAIAAGVAAARLPARMELLCADPLLLLDGGHNPDAGQALAAAIDRFLQGRPLIALCGMMADKDVGAYLAYIVPRVAQFIACCPANPRAMPAQALATEASLLAARDEKTEIKAISDPLEALQEAKQQQSRTKGAALLICGSFYLAGEIKQHLI